MRCWAIHEHPNHQYRFDPTATDANSYLQQNDNSPDPRFQSLTVPIDAIAVSSGQNDAGVFELNFKDERYLPFEGAGVISKWQLDLPSDFRQFDYDSITDVIFTVRYISKNGGDKLRKPAGDSVLAYIQSVEDLSRTQGLFALFDLKSEFALEWARASGSLATVATSSAQAQPTAFHLNNLVDRLPMFTRGRDHKKIVAQNITLLTQTDLPPSAYSLSVDPTGNQDPIVFSSDPNSVGTLQVMTAGDEVGATFAAPWTLNITGAGAKLQKIWLLIRYTLAK
jgi:hypothetical protein